MYLGVLTATPGLINLAARKEPQTRQATAPKKKARKTSKKTSKKGKKKATKKRAAKKRAAKKRAAKKKVGLFIQKPNIVYHPAVLFKNELFKNVEINCDIEQHGHFPAL